MRQQTGRLVQTGMARLRATATAKNGSDTSFQTRLTEVAHQSPNRLIPIRSLAMERAGACICALSSYGGGMVQGDSSHVNIHVQPNARLGVVTQGSNRIYYTSGHTTMDDKTTLSSPSSCQSIIQAKVESNAMLVFAPDPCVPFAESDFTQELVLDVQDTSSIVLVDWFSAGRIHNGELWHLTRLSSKIKMIVNGKLVLVESLALHQNVRRGDCFGFWCDYESEPLTTFGSILLHGDQAYPVVEQFRILQDQLAAHYTSIRPSTRLQPPFENALDIGCFRGRVVVGLSSSSTQLGTYMARIAATCTEDLYRVLHFGLRPLKNLFGLEFYKDRLQASQSSTSTNSGTRKFRDNNAQTSNNSKRTGKFLTALIKKRFDESEQGQKVLQQNITNATASTWISLMLADSSLPTGGFAHSASLEAASQLKWFDNGSNHDGGEATLSAYIQAATRSALQLQIPLVLAAYGLLRTGTGPVMEQWRQLDDYTHALLNFNAPACRASLDQGQSLLRITKLLVQDVQHLQLLEHIQADIVAATSSTRGHFAPMFGVCAAMLLPDHDSSELELCTLLGYCTGRTLVSAAIRLNLIGPMASLPLLAKIEQATREGIEAAYASIHQQQDVSMKPPSLECFMNAAATSAPVIDAIHNCHDLLQTRLFRT